MHSVFQFTLGLLKLTLKQSKAITSFPFSFFILLYLVGGMLCNQQRFKYYVYVIVLLNVLNGGG